MLLPFALAVQDRGRSLRRPVFLSSRLPPAVALLCLRRRGRQPVWSRTLVHEKYMPPSQH